jgi:hypothetical protein
MPTPQYNFYRHRKERQNVSAFAALIETPAVGAVTLPAGARVSFVAVAGAVAGTPLATVTGTTNRTIGSQGLAAGERQALDYLERAVVITPQAGVDVYVDAGLSVWKKIAGSP